MTERKMTEKGFLHKSSGRISAVAFLQAHRQFLETGTLAQSTSPILARLDSGDIMPTPALSEIRQAVMHHLLNKQTEKLPSESVHSTRAPREPSEKKPYSATVLDGKGNAVEIDGKILTNHFNNSIEAQRWLDRRLYDGAQNYYGEIVHVSGRTMKVDRLDSIARVLKAGHGPVTRQNKCGGGSWKMKAKGDHFHFSHG